MDSSKTFEKNSLRFNPVKSTRMRAAVIVSPGKSNSIKSQFQHLEKMKYLSGLKAVVFVVLTFLFGKDVRGLIILRSREPLAMRDLVILPELVTKLII